MPVGDVNLLRRAGWPEAAIQRLPSTARVSRYYWNYGAPVFQGEKGHIAVSGLTSAQAAEFSSVSPGTAHWKGKDGGFLHVEEFGRVPGISARPADVVYFLPPPSERPSETVRIIFAPTQKVERTKEGVPKAPAVGQYYYPESPQSKGLFFIRPLSVPEIEKVVRVERQKELTGKPPTDLAEFFWRWGPEIAPNQYSSANASQAKKSTLFDFPRLNLFGLGNIFARRK